MRAAKNFLPARFATSVAAKVPMRQMRCMHNAFAAGQSLCCGKDDGSKTFAGMTFRHAGRDAISWVCAFGVGVFSPSIRRTLVGPDNGLRVVYRIKMPRGCNWNCISHMARHSGGCPGWKGVALSQSTNPTRGHAGSVSACRMHGACGGRAGLSYAAGGVGNGQAT
jgi:hypothetical protein